GYKEWKENDFGAVRSVYLEYRIKRAKGGMGEASRIPLYAYETDSVVPHAAAALVDMSLPLPGFRLKGVGVATRWSLADLVPEEGDTILVQACAHDFNDVAAFDVPGRSLVLKLQVVAKSALTAEVDDAQAKLQQELVRLREQQEAAI